MKVEKLDSLTVARFVAAFAVFVYHGWPMFAPSYRDDFFWVYGGRLGFLGVPFFFALSGFVLSFVYVTRGAVSASGWIPDGKARFIAARIGRIYPIYLLALVLTLPLLFRTLDQPGRFVTAAVLSPLMLQSWWPPVALDWNGPAWSLSVEALFYAVFPVFIVRLLRKSRRGMWGMAVAAFLFSAIVTVAVTWLEPALQRPGPFRGAEMFYHNLGRYWPLMHAASFAIGAVCGLEFVRRRDDARVRDIAIAFPVSLSLVAVLAFDDRIPYLWLHNVLAIPGFAGAIYAIARLNSRLKRWTPNWAILLGDASYCLYLLHIVMLRGYIRGWEAAFGASPTGIVHFAVCAILATAGAALSFTLFEEPLRRVISTALTQRFTNGRMIRGSEVGQA